MFITLHTLNYTRAPCLAAYGVGVVGKPYK